MEMDPLAKLPEEASPPPLEGLSRPRSASIAVHIFVPSSSTSVPNSNVEMEPVQANPTIGFSVVAMPYPGRGHINPMMNLCKLLVSRNDRIAITFVVTEEWLGILRSEPKPANIRFGTVPNVIPSEIGRGADLASFYEAVMTKLQEPFERLLDRLEPSVIVYDTFLSWMVGVGNRRSILLSPAHLDESKPTWMSPSPVAKPKPDWSSCGVFM
ncbi:UDP-Glycosyltransferase superfamily protein [Actinidia rufa]|uniref:UDP-Glycosyltransferase superfamily protein n=1 Tax=Actinidia rufa TaxID=165716 RepID=A0A7J0GRL8_9ERIC|nr:UDP-Glycosyltransferase superfamily protein [Actinidia rufa]